VHTDLVSGNVELLGITAPTIRVVGFAFAVVATGLPANKSECSGVFSAFRVTAVAWCAGPTPPAPQPTARSHRLINRFVISRILSQGITCRFSLPIRSRFGNTGD
jgi:hypothetical protein